MLGWLLMQATRCDAATAELKQTELPVLRVDTRELSPGALGSELGRLWKSLFPDLERRLDQLLAERLGRKLFMPSLAPPEVGLSLSAFTDSDRAELRGLSDSLHLARESRLGDGLLSAEELLLVQFLVDFGAYGAGSGFGVFANRDRALGPLVARTVVLGPGGNAAGVGSIPETLIVYEQGDKSFVSLTLAGSLGVTSGFNHRGLFISVLPAVGVPAVLQPPDATEPIAFAVRRALQGSGRIDQALRMLRSGRYGLNHSLLIADRQEVQVLELPLNGVGRRRTAVSRLHPAMAWDHRGAIAVVGCFALADMPSDCDDIRQRSRWQHFQALARGDSIARDADLGDLVQIMLDGKDRLNEGYRQSVRQVLAFAPNSLDLVVGHLSPASEEPLSELVMQRFTNLLERSQMLQKSAIRWLGLVWLSIAILLVITLWVRYRSNKRKIPLREPE